MVTYVLRKNGEDDSWESLVPYVKKCKSFANNTRTRNEETNAPLELISNRHLNRHLTSLPHPLYLPHNNFTLSRITASKAITPLQ
ncbi:hypothetical protein COCCADRAFT_81930 [Bipolaris zeicola 26-R-13]|uniref:Uncharacterized protein n=1 Tax=Cochliobolus carbonum (strain 26-R-13) TaxID=930089 RepID=W6YMY4_COCC2|nr:uncharacterized protein COCCADRAFT_81930 [Bipolaris zeicola 26-R-13]EUC38858.1 hypothetical protein COCCADRAFT_81930 [Bipolaris zeicola 26-R-13]